MPDTTSDDSLLLVRCPSCRQRFKVNEELRGRTVECGGCDHRFKINDEVIIRGRKAYPGERRSPLLDRLQRVPHSGAAFMPMTKTVTYGEAPDLEVIGPVSPLRIIAGAAGVIGMVIISLLLIFGAHRGGALDGMTFVNRLVLAGFTSVMGIGALIYANPRARWKALGVSLLLSAGVVSVPFFFQEGSIPLQQGLVKESAEPLKPWMIKTRDDSDIALLKARIGTGPLEAEIEKMVAGEGEKRAFGLWLRGLSNNHKYLVRDYLLRVTDADPSSHAYPRDQGDYLFVVTGTTLTFQELAKLASALGEPEKMYPEIGVIEIRVKNENFVEGPIEKLQNSQHPEFYEQNKRELECIDLERVKRAVQRLAKVEPKIYRNDVTRRLISILGEPDIDFKGNVCEALSVWSEQPGPAGQAALKEVNRLLKLNAAIPPEMIALLVKEKNPDLIPVLHQLWLGSPQTWESLYGDLGIDAEASVLENLPETSGNLRHSAVRILGRVGRDQSLKALTAIEVGADSELAVLIEQSKKSITGRLGR
jgi:predicted Zn finger-like uncharacterized protein